MSTVMLQSPPDGFGLEREVGQSTTHFNCLPCKDSHAKCTKEKPTCPRCARMGYECVYPPNPDPKLSVPQSHLHGIELRIEQLIQSVQELKTEVEVRRGNNTSNASHIFNTVDSGIEDRLRSNELHDRASSDSVDNNVEGDFVPTFGNTIQPPHMTAVDFSSLRLRRSLSRNGTPQSLQFLNHFDSAKIHRCVVTFSDQQLPPVDEARRLVKAVLAFIGPDYQLISKKSFLDTVENTCRLKRNPYPADQTWYCRMFTVFALGELYTLRPRPRDEKGVPGCAYFEYAMELFQDLYEEPTIEYIETILLIAFYEYALNNRNSAYIRAGLALRLSLTLRLHLEPPENCSPRERAHRVRVWSTVYILDRISSSKVGLPVTVRDEDIDAPIPSLVGLTDFDIEDSYGHDHVILILQLELARITGDLLSALYRTTRLDRTNDILQKVKKVVLELTTWRKSLPSTLEFNPKADPSYSSRSVASLHLNFSQCVMLTTRSIFFYIFAFRTESTIRQPVPPWQALLGSEELSETCVDAARQSSSILMKLKEGGHLALYGFFDALAVFSSALILMMSLTVQFRTLPNDSKRVEALRRILEEMRDAGNMSAFDYYQELIECKHRLEQTREQMDRASDPFHVTTEGSNGVEHPMHTNFLPGPSRSDAGAEQGWYEQMNMSDLGDVNTSDLLERFELQAVVQDTNMSWEVDTPGFSPPVFSNSDGTLRDFNEGGLDFLEFTVTDIARPEDHRLSSAYYYSRTSGRSHGME